MSVKITLPYPPSANRYWRTAMIGRGRTARVSTYVSEEAKLYKKQVFYLCHVAQLKPFTGSIKLVLDVYRPRRVGDLSNRIKVLEDSLTGYAFNDDKQVIEIIARRYEDKNDPRVEVEILEIDDFDPETKIYS